MLQQRQNVQNAKTMDNTKKEIDNKNNNRNLQPLFHRKTFEDKKRIFIIAKTWGAARVFYFKTELQNFRNIKIEYLYNIKQIKPEMNRLNTVIIQLSGANFEEINVSILNFCEAKNLEIIKYKGIAPTFIET